MVRLDLAVATTDQVWHSATTVYAFQMPEELTDVGRGITICHQSFGDPADPPLLLVMGLGMQMVAWHEDFCKGWPTAGST